MSAAPGLDRLEPCLSDESRLKYTVVYIYDGSGFLFCRKRGRETWECAGGHIEPGETAEAGALREVYEETGLRLPNAEPLFDYFSTDKTDGSSAWGRIFLCRTERLSPPPVPPREFEMEETRVFSSLPERMSYPGIQEAAFPDVLKRV